MCIRDLTTETPLKTEVLMRKRASISIILTPFLSFLSPLSPDTQPMAKMATDSAAKATQWFSSTSCSGSESVMMNSSHLRMGRPVLIHIAQKGLCKYQLIFMHYDLSHTLSAVLSSVTHKNVCALNGICPAQLNASALSSPPIVVFRRFRSDQRGPTKLQF